MDDKNNSEKDNSEETTDLQKIKEVDIMAMAQLQRSSAITINKNKIQDFFKTLSDNRPSKEFWDKCKKTRESITREDINTINSLIKKRLENDR